MRQFRFRFINLSNRRDIWGDLVYRFQQCLRIGNVFKIITAEEHWGRVTHNCVSKLTIIGSDNGLSPGRRLAIIWTNAGILSIVPFVTNFSEISIEIYTFSFKKIHLKLSSGKWRPSCLGLNVLTIMSYLAAHTMMAGGLCAKTFDAIFRNRDYKTVSGLGHE